MKTKIALESLAMDLRRVAQCYHRGSNKSAERFSQEALKRVSEINKSELKQYIVNILDKIELELSQDDTTARAESSLMYSTLFQNYTLKYY